MNAHHLSLSSFIVLSFFLVTPSHCQLEDANYFVNCSRQYDCGNITNIPYPFSGGPRPEFCGHVGYGYELKCFENQFPFFDFEELEFRVLNINQSSRTMTIARSDLWGYPCPSKFINTTLNFSHLHYASNVHNLTLYYGCPPDILNILAPNNFTCVLPNSTGDATTAFYADESIESKSYQNLTECEFNIRVPIFDNLLIELHEGGAGELQKALNKGFDVEFNAFPFTCRSCVESGGKCGSNSTHEFLCFCRNQVQEFVCSDKGKSNVTLKIVIGVFGSGGGVILTCIIFCCFRSKKPTIMTRKFWTKITKNEEDLEAFIRNYGPLALKRYQFSDVKKMTNSFTDKLGQGGYGGVYKGELLDGSPVAVKLLNTSKGNGEEFINEVASISKTSHVNIVTLLGFCFEGGKRALIYEFMPNGSLEKFIYNDKPEKTAVHMGWEKLFQIATGTARGLEYLHRGCNTRILHFDIKPHNILLDKDFLPKISDFGLAKLCPMKESIISMMDTRGTIGYIAPEVFSRSFGVVSHKSDVYSYGMMVLEMVGGRKNVDVGTSHTSEIYFPHWIYKHLELGNNLGFPGNMTKEENEMAKKMTLVGLWCIQTNPLDRPSTSKVIEMLEGSIEALQIPPKPYLSSPPRLPIESVESSATSML